MGYVKIALYMFLFALLLFAAYAYVVLEYGTPVSRKGLREIHAVSSSSGGHTNVSVDGILLGSAVAVSGITQHQKAHCIVVVVRQGIVREGRKESAFHLDIVVPNDVDEIAFDNSRDIIWHR